MPAVLVTGFTVTQNALIFLALVKTIASTPFAYSLMGGQAELA